MSQRVDIVFHPAKAHPVKAAAVAFLLGVGFQALWQLVEPLTALVLSGILVVSVRDFYLETRTVFDPEGIAVRGLLKASLVYPWRRFRAFVEDRNGLYLTPYRTARRTEACRGVFLPMTPVDRKRAVELCLAHNLVRRSR